MTQQALLQLKGISKVYPGVRALNDVDLEIYPGEVLALVGENGAGKSTLIKILSGVLDGWSGEMFWEGRPVLIKAPWMAQSLGIATIYQELTLCGNLSVAENVFLGREPKKFGGLIDWKKMNRDTARVLESLQVSISPTTEVSRLSVANQQLIEIARALTMNAKLIIMDEPTSSLSGYEVKILMDIVKSLVAKGISILYVSHKFEEIFELSDRISILRDGEYIDTVITKEAALDHIISRMVGRQISSYYPRRELEIGEAVLSVRNLTRKNVFHDIEFELHKGEIVGVSGLVGSGRTEFARAIFGIDQVDSGEICIEGRWRALPATPLEALGLGIGFLPEDRKEHGLVLLMSVADNTTLTMNAKKGAKFLIHFPEEKRMVAHYMEKLTIRTPSEHQLVGNLSGGNQQKVVIAKWLATQSRILIFDEPTRGIDVGAKAEIYELMNELVSQGYAIMMISSELPEVIGMSDRVIVMHEGRMTATLSKEEVSPEKIMRYATGSS